ncbi:glutamate--cysteine ligase [Mariprofundus erugo]|uniref:glutamate--cysteine ligase n=1 Tax=Mariprofundus erugo TaxID=2528639 RepID=UPI0010FD5A87|nr:glutamate--cysteine ligase [Mariprofundus erugo]TLS75794.1 glutamate--cysteine ligase [Mariprofundus erugo]
MNKPLTSHDFAAWFARGCKPREQWRIGTEHEKIGFCMDTLRPIPYEGERGIHAVLQRLAGGEWQPVCENGQPIALQNRMASVTLEPGGQLELSGAPLDSIHATCMETTGHLNALQEISRELRIGFLGMGFQPRWQQQEIPWMPKERYAVMRRYMPRVGNGGLDMMLRTATVQANLDFASEADMARKMRISMCLQPLVTALFAASPFEDGRPSGYLSRRAACWLDTDAARTGIPACVFEDDFGFHAYTEWALDAPMYFVIRDGHYVDCAGSSFRDFMHGALPQFPGEYPTMDDWELHVSTLFPDVRLKQYLEMRGADAGPWPWICALPALWKGLLYEPVAEQAAWEMIADWTHAEVTALRQAVPRTAMHTPFRDGTLQQQCARMVGIAGEGLARLDIRNQAGESEARFLAPLRHAVESGETQAERWLAAWRDEWHEDISRLFVEAMHL